MAGNRSRFWDDFFEDDNERSDSPEVIYGDMLEEFRELYYNTVIESPNYAEMDNREKEFLAEEFMELFYYGGYSAADQEAWIHMLGLRTDDFRWSEYATVYDAIQG
jgi:hypothetical protein